LSFRFPRVEGDEKEERKRRRRLENDQSDSTKQFNRIYPVIENFDKETKSVKGG
jgi:hypothetical protein